MVKTINLTNSDELILVDDEDYDYLVKWNWQLLIKNNSYKVIIRCERINII